MTISFVIPTRDREGVLEKTLSRLGELDFQDELVELIVVDNASRKPVALRERLDNGVGVEVVRLEKNLGAAARNVGAERARGEWVVMLDDDSVPMDAGFVEALADAPGDVAAVGAEILLPDGSRERGGLPEVVIGCGAAYRREAFAEVEGYDARYGFYGEEYDLCAKLMLAGYRAVHDARFGVVHEKTTSGRNMNEILFRLVRNNAWTMLRYAPRGERRKRLWETISRYAKIAWKEDALMGYAWGVWELATCSWWRQPRREMDGATWDRFTGLARARATFEEDERLHAGVRAALVARGKNSWVVEEALGELGVVIVEDEADADVLVVGTMSPGPMMDAWESRQDESRPVIRGWSMEFGEALTKPESSTMVA